MNSIASELNEAQQTWLNQIRQWEKEMGMMAAANSALVDHVTDNAGKARLDHFENRFVIELGKLDAMKHNIKLGGIDPQRGQQELADYAASLAALRAEFQAFQAAPN
jgi:hypothetical protein